MGLAFACIHHPQNPGGALQVLKNIVTEVGKGGASPPPAYQQFILQLAGPVALHSVLTVSFQHTY